MASYTCHESIQQANISMVWVYHVFSSMSVEIAAEIESISQVVVPVLSIKILVS